MLNWKIYRYLLIRKSISIDAKIIVSFNQRKVMNPPVKYNIIVLKYSNMKKEPQEGHKKNPKKITS